MTLAQFKFHSMDELEEEWNNGARKLFTNWDSFCYYKWSDYLRGE